MRAIDLFAGAGGADLGLRRAGIDVVRAIEWDRDAAATLAASGAHAVQGDVRDPAHYADLPSIDLLWASPPCQDWSSAGKREGAKGERNGWPWTLDVIDQVRPTWAIFENVAGMLHHTGGCRCPHGPPEECPAGYFHRWILPQLRERFAVVDYRLLDAADYGVPQRRHRVFVVAGPGEFAWPGATHAEPGMCGGLFSRLRAWVTVREAIGLTVPMRAVRGAGLTERHGERPDYPPDAPAPTIAAGSKGSGPRLEVGGNPVTVSRNGRARIEYALNEEPDNVRGPSDLVRRHPIELPDAPANTLATGRPVYILDATRDLLPWPAWIATHGTQGGSWREYARLAGHPEDGFHPDGSPRLVSPVPWPAWAWWADMPAVDPRHPDAHPNEPAPTIRSGGDGHSAPPMWLRTECLGAVAWPDTDPAPTLSGKANTYVHPKDPGERRAGDKVGRAASEPERLDAPAPTVTAQEVKGTRAHGAEPTFNGGPDRASDALWLATGRRRLTPAECAALQTFPPDYPWQGTQTAIYRQIGNAVPPLMAEQLGRALVATVARRGAA
jgi:site-specific DNA-cytosine methylase